MKKHVKIISLIALLVFFVSSCVVLAPNRTNRQRNKRRVELTLPAGNF
ncbi:MAG: hypothetical protein PQJ60_07160 [Spirochaetales bacterium]|nr:hypothetical protein [Spirochaetales bacterium]